MTLETYKLLHMVGIMMVFLGFGALVARAMMSSDHVGARKFGGIVSGIGLVLLILGGFGMQVKLKEVVHLTDWWVLVKIGVRR